MEHNLKNKYFIITSNGDNSFRGGELRNKVIKYLYLIHYFHNLRYNNISIKRYPIYIYDNAIVFYYW